MSGASAFVKKQFVVIIAGILMLVSCAMVPVTDYTKYINTDVIGILFSLMLVIAGFRANNMLTKLSGWLVRTARVNSTRKALLVMSLMTFVLSMLVTNDAALIALVPITLIFFEQYGKDKIYAVVVQTVAANVGSMATPFGNPQNLFIYTNYNISAGDFFLAVLPTAFAGLAIILLMCLFMPEKPLDIVDDSDVKLLNKPYLVLYGVLFVLCMLAVFNVLDVITVFASACVVIVITEPKRFADVDFGLLMTFIFFFIFVGNLKMIDGVSDFMTNIVNGREFTVSVAASQIMSNVPAAMMLAGFTENWKALLLGVDVGALGTPVASLASLISLRIYGEEEDASQFNFLGVFSIVNVVCLAVLFTFTFFTQLKQ